MKSDQCYVFIYVISIKIDICINIFYNPREPSILTLGYIDNCNCTCISFTRKYYSIKLVGFFRLFIQYFTFMCYIYRFVGCAAIFI